MGEIIKWPRPSTPLRFTGERLTTAYGGQTEIEHLHRYLVAREWCRDKDVLDVASGEGYGTALLAQVARSAVGVEIAPEAVDHAREAYKTNNLSFVVGDARSLPSPDATFDVVTSFETIEHFAEQQRFLSEIRRVLRPGGLLIISTPDRDNYSPTESPANPFHVRELTREEFDALLRSYFAEVSVLLQRPMFGSVLLPNGANKAAPLCFERRGDEHFEGSLNLPRPQYVVAFASGNTIPALPPSVYIDTGRLGMMRPSDADAQLQLVRHELAGARDELYALEVDYQRTIRDLGIAYTDTVDSLKQAFSSASKRHLAMRNGKAVLSAARRVRAGGNVVRSIRRLLRRKTRQKDVEFSAIFGSDLFDPDYYLMTYQDVKAAGVDPALHYLNLGDAEGRNPGPAFSTRRYREMNPDVPAHGITALGHYEMFGRQENRPLPFPEAQFAIPPIRTPKASLLERAALTRSAREWLTYEPMARRIAEEKIHRLSRTKPAPAPMMAVAADETLAAIAKALDFAREDRPLVSIIVPAFNNLKFTLECLLSLQKYTDARISFEIIVADDASTDASQSVLQRVPNIIYVRNKENIGFLMNCNGAASIARGKFVLFLNNDVQVTQDWLVGLVSVFAKSDRIGAAGPRILYPGGHLQEAGGLVKADCTTQLIGLNDDPTLDRYSFARRVDYCSGACLILRRSVFTEVGGFSEFLRPAYCEDLDLCLKLRKAGYETWYTPEATVLHHLSKTSDEIGGSYKMRHIVENTQKISERWQDDIDDLNRVRIFSFYLPQYHPISENNKWWGPGFTEWTNVTRGAPQYEGHWQPRLPADLGFYDLRRSEVLEEQADLARRYGVTGFCYYYYWFAGKRLLELPVETMLTSGKPELPFLLCWANENWTRRWDGRESEILISQSHSDEDDVAVILDLIRYFRDPRYVRIDGRPLLLIYRVGLFPDFARTAALWRETCRAQGIGEIYLAMVASFDEAGKRRRPQSVGCDAAVQFPPHGGGVVTPPRADLRSDFSGTVWDYEESVLSYLRQSPPAAPYFPGVMPSWDNTARRMSTSSVFEGATPGAFQAWLEEAIRLTCEHNVGDERIVFVNAWNEWAEGAHLEPDQMFGHSNLEAVRNALLTHALNAKRH